MSWAFRNGRLGLFSFALFMVYLDVEWPFVRLNLSTPWRMSSFKAAALPMVGPVLQDRVGEAVMLAVAFERPSVSWFFICFWFQGFLQCLR